MKEIPQSCEKCPVFLGKFLPNINQKDFPEEWWMSIVVENMAKSIKKQYAEKIAKPFKKTIKPYLDIRF